MTDQTKMIAVVRREIEGTRYILKILRWAEWGDGMKVKVTVLF